VHNEGVKKHQNGFSPIELILIISIISVVVFAGKFVYDTRNMTVTSKRSNYSDKQSATGVKKIVAIGDISCEPKDINFAGNDSENCQANSTQKLIEKLNPDNILALGDLQYENGSYSNFIESYDKTWAKQKSITLPTTGNHEYLTSAASGYFTYFNGSNTSGKAGKSSEGYYSVMIGDWKIIALNSNCKEIGGCDKDSAQSKWLEKELSNTGSACTLAYWHHPHYTSGKYANEESMKNLSANFWNLLVTYKADIVLNGHDHIYERFAQQTANGALLSTGVRQFTVGTGGKNLYKQIVRSPASEKLIDNKFGALELELYGKAYKWRFITNSGEILDSGEQTCNL